MTKHHWNESPAYKKWVKQRDRALEVLHTRAQQESSDILRRLLTEVLMAAKGNYHAMKMNQHGAMHNFEHYMQMVFSNYTARFYNVMLNLRARSYTLAKASEAEIIAQISTDHLPKVATVNFNHIHQQRYKDSTAGGPVFHRLQLYLDKLRRKIVSFAQGAALNAPDDTAFLIDVAQSFPRKRIVRRPKRILKPKLMEARGSRHDDTPVTDDGSFHQISEDPPADIAIDNIDDATWQDMLDAYQNDYVPTSRQPEYVVDLPIADPTIQADGTEVYYAWEFERDLTDEFVQSVRDGQIDSANENGITDFVIISVIDSHTCDDCCGEYGCVDFDGLLVSEIEKLTDGDQSTPPYHFNCRCTLAPATDDIPEKPDTMSKEFDDWLTT